MKASKLKLQRIKLGVSQSDLAEATGLSQSRISLLERGIVPNINEAELIAYELAVKPDKIFNNIK